MASKNFGKQTEQKFKECYQKSVPDGFILRLADQVSGFSNSCNIADFICFHKGVLIPAEIKSVQTVSFPFANLRQYERMEAVSGIKGVKPVVIMWFTYLDRVIAVPIITIRKMKKNGLKSLNPKTIDRDKYYIMDIPSIKLKTFMDSDYSVLDNLPEIEEIEKWGEG